VVPPDSHRITRVLWYSGTGQGRRLDFRLRGFHPVLPGFPADSANPTLCNSPAGIWPRQVRPHNPRTATPIRLTPPGFGLFPVRSPLLRESLLISLPPGTEMFHFPGLAPTALWIQMVGTAASPRWVAPFGNPRINARSQLPEAYRSRPRPSSPPDAKASTVRPCSLDRPSLLEMYGPKRPHGNLPKHLEMPDCQRPKSGASGATGQPSRHSGRRAGPCRLVEVNGIEPMTSCLQSRRSPN
jgi:hypothetical protein